jgi:phosphopantothenoylcysteine decarboxylase/phosphopantothenate--cysteine ligase
VSKLDSKKVLLGVTGGIAAYKIPELVRLLVKSGATPRCVVTARATQFVTPLTLQAVSQAQVYQDNFDASVDHGMAHIQLAEWAELIVIAPASANCLAKLAHGLADDLLSTLVLATQAPVMIFPAMNAAMWHHPQTQANVAQCKALGYHVVDPAQGEQACGANGLGRMLEPIDILTHIESFSDKPQQDLAGLRFLLTAGPTQEPIDPVRFIANRSSGKMGYALAEQAAVRGAAVTLISGPVQLPVPNGVQCISVTTAEEMHQAVLEMISNQDIFIGVAAVSDYRCIKPSEHKIKKGPDQHLTLELVRNPDILEAVAAHPAGLYCVGFAAETQQGLAYAEDKLATKKCDMIALNQVGGKHCAFNSDDNALIVITATGHIQLERAPKSHIADQLLTLVKEQYDAKHSG